MRKTGHQTCVALYRTFNKSLVYKATERTIGRNKKIRGNNREINNEDFTLQLT